MTVADVLSGLNYWPKIPLGISGAANISGTSAIQLNAADEGVGAVFRIPKTGNITSITWMTGSTVATGATMEVRLETIDATLNPAGPSGTLHSSGTNGTTVVATSATNTVFTTTLTNPAAVTRGDLRGVVIKQPNSSPGDMRIQTFGDNGGGNQIALPYMVQNQATSPTVTWTTAENGGSLILALNYDDGTSVVPDGFSACSAINGASYNTSTTPDVKGAHFTTEVDLVVRGAWAWLFGNGDFDVKLVNTTYHQANNTGVLASVSVDKDVKSQGFGGVYLLEFASDVNLPAGTYRLIVEPTTTTSVQFYDQTMLSQAVFNSFQGADFHYTQAKDPTGNGDWTNMNNGTDGYRYPFCGLIVSGITLPNVSVTGGSYVSVG